MNFPPQLSCKITHKLPVARESESKWSFLPLIKTHPRVSVQMSGCHWDQNPPVLRRTKNPGPRDWDETMALQEWDLIIRRSRIQFLLSLSCHPTYIYKPKCIYSTSLCFFFSPKNTLSTGNPSAKFLDVFPSGSS